MEPSEIRSHSFTTKVAMGLGIPNFLMKLQGTPGSAGVSALGGDAPPLGTLSCSSVWATLPGEGGGVSAVVHAQASS